MCASKTVEKRKLDILKRESLTCPSDILALCYYCYQMLINYAINTKLVKVGRRKDFFKAHA